MDWVEQISHPLKTLAWFLGWCEISLGRYKECAQPTNALNRKPESIPVKNPKRSYDKSGIHYAQILHIEERNCNRNAVPAILKLQKNGKKCEYSSYKDFSGSRQGRSVQEPVHDQIGKERCVNILWHEEKPPRHGEGIWKVGDEEQTHRPEQIPFQIFCSVVSICQQIHKHGKRQPPNGTEQDVVIQQKQSDMINQHQ